MSWVADAKAEWDKLPNGGKVAVAGIGLLTVGIAGYEWYINRNASATASNQAGVPSTDPNAPGTGVGGLSALDTQSLASMIAGLVNTQGQVGATGAQGTPGTPGMPSPIGVAGRDYGLIPFGQYKGPSYSNLKPNTFFSFNGIKYLLSTGPQGKLYGRDPSGNIFLLYEPQSFYPGGTNYKGPPVPQPVPSPTVVNSSPVLPSPTIHISG